MKNKPFSLRASSWLDRLTGDVIDGVIVLLLIFTASALLDSASFTARGIETIKFLDFSELGRMNPDTVAWLRIDGTHINHPVVQGKDDFEYLDMDFYGKYYAGGTLFLAAGCGKDFEDDYSLIHGHHMAGGAMFGDLAKFLKKDFFDGHCTGVLFTAAKNYRLDIIAAGTADAYDSGIYDISAGKKAHGKAIEEAAVRKRGGTLTEGKLLILSTCTGDPGDMRTVVVCRMQHDPKLSNRMEGKKA